MVIDSSALLSYLRDESGAEKVQAMLGAESLKVTVVNWAETQGKLEGSELLQQRIIRGNSYASLIC